MDGRPKNNIVRQYAPVHETPPLYFDRKREKFFCLDGNVWEWRDDWTILFDGNLDGDGYL